MIKLKELHLQNFRSWEELHLTGLDEMGLCLIQAPNGYGKSSIRQAIEYLLLDCTAEGLSPEDLSRDGSKGCKMEISLDRDGDDVKIIKYRDFPSFGNKTILSLNGDESLTYTDRRVTQREIEKLLDISSQTMLVSTIFSQDSSSFPEIKETDRKKILYDALGLHEYTDYHSNAKSRCEELLEEKNICINKMSYIQGDVGRLDAEFEELDSKHDTFNTDKNKRGEGLKREKALLIEEDLSLLKNEMSAIKVDLIDEKGFNIRGIEEKIKATDQASHDINEKMIPFEIRLSSLGEGTCPVFKDECDKLSEHNDVVKKECEPEIKSLKKEREALYVQRNSLKEELDKINKIFTNNEEIFDKVKSLRQRLELKDQLNRGMQTRKEEIDKRIEETSNERNPYAEMMQKIVDTLKFKRSEIQELDERVRNLRENIMYYEFWKEGFSPKGLPNLKSESFLEALENETNEILSGIRGRLVVNIEGQSELRSGETREKISYSVNGENYSRFSGGERQRVRIADLFGFNRIISKFNMLVLDEVLELSLDSSGIENVLQILRNESRRLGTIIVISHNENLKSFFDKVLNIEKKKGISHFN